MGASIFNVATPWQIKCLAIFIVFAGFAILWQQHRQLAALRALRLQEGNVNLIFSDASIVGTVHGQSIVTDWVAIFTVKIKDKRALIHLVMPRDTLSREDHRVLRVWLKNGSRLI